MLPFIVALVFAVGLPLLPSSLHRALGLPSLKFNFLSARHAPEQVLVSSPETMLRLQSAYNGVDLDSGGSPQYLVFPDITSADCLNDAAAPICMSLSEEQDYPQPSIWNIIHAQLLYQLAEATIIITLSFFASATLLSRRYLFTFAERLCIALFISRHYSPKAAFSSFLQDVFCGLHQYWMNDSVSNGDSVVTNSQQEALGAFVNTVSGEGYERDTSVPSLSSVSNLQDNLDLVSSDKSSLGSVSSSSVSITPSHCSKVSSESEPAPTSLLDMSIRPFHNNADTSKQEGPQFNLGTSTERYLPCTTQSTITSKTTSINTETPLQPKINLSPSAEIREHNSDACFPVGSSPPISSTGSLPSVSMEDLYKSSRLINIPTFSPEPPRIKQEVGVSGPSSHSQSSCNYKSFNNVDYATTNPEFPWESDSSSSLAIPQGSRRRYKSDGIQVLATSCRLKDTTSPAKVDVTCAFWKGAPQISERRAETLVKETSASVHFPRSLQSPRIRRNKSEQGQNNLSAADAALAGLVVTAEGDLIVPASQRPDGSMRKEIRLRSGYALRESFGEKYLPPAARRRTSTWNPLLREYSLSSSSSPQRNDSPQPSTPRGFRQRPFVHPVNSPASQSDNWRRSNSGRTANATLPAIVDKVTEAKPSPAAVEAPERIPPPEISPPDCPVRSKTDPISTTPIITTPIQETAAAVGQKISIQPADRFSSLPITIHASTEKETASVKVNAGVTKDSKSVDAAHNNPDNLENQQPEARNLTSTTSAPAGREDRRPLRDITFTFSAPRSKAPGEYQALPPPTTVATPAIFSQVSDIFSKDHLLKTPIRANEDLNRVIRETALNSPRKRRPSAESNVSSSAVAVPTVFPFEASDASLSTPAYPNRIPRARRSAPHLNKCVGKQQHEGKIPRAVQTPDGLKRRRMRTASSRGVENWSIDMASVAPTIDHSGQIVLPAGTGWKGRSLVTAGQTPQH